MKAASYFFSICLSQFGAGLSIALAAGGIATDGSVGGPAQVLSAPNASANLEIPQSRGETHGANLFHSFSAFNIETGQTVTFTENVPNSLDNVISRVTGGSASEINGILRSTPGGHANFYLINPAGVLFGADARVDVPAALRISTADEVIFNDGKHFLADTASASAFSSAAPAAFGFLGTSAANNGLIQMDGSQIGLADGQTLDLVAGDIQVENGTGAMVSGGAIRLAAMHGAGTADIGAETLLPAQTPSATNAGNITVTGSGFSTSGDGGGTIALWGKDIVFTGGIAYADNTGSVDATADKGIAIRAQSLTLDQSPVTSDAYAGTTGDAGNVSIETTGKLEILNGGYISSSSYDDGNAGNISVKADTLIISRNGSSLTGITADAEDGSGNAGLVRVQANSVNLLNGGEIRSSSSSAGNAVGVEIKADTITIDGQGSPYATGISSNSDAGSGNAGQLTVEAGSLRLLRGGAITSSTWTDGDAGPISVSADRVLIDNQDNVFGGSGIFSQAESGSGGKGGNISVQAGSLEILHKNSQISSSTASTGRGGEIAISADQLKLNGGGELSVGIRSGSQGSGDGGDISIRAGSLAIVRGSGISSAANAGGGAGNISVHTGTMTIGKDGIISSSSRGTDSSGRTGNIAVTATDWLHLFSADISSENEANISDANLANGMTPGNIRISAHDIVMRNSRISAHSTGNVAAGAIDIEFARTFSLDPSFITTEANNGNGGSITISGGDWIRLQNSGLMTTVHGSGGNGGNINVGAGVLIMDNGLIQANTSAAGGSGGNIDLKVGAIVASGDTLLIGGNHPIAWQPGIFGLNVIQAAAPIGLSGTITSTAPRLNLSGDLANLGQPQFDRSTVDAHYCALDFGSSLIRTGKGGLLPKASDWSAY